MDNKKKSITILIIGIVALLLVVGGATFAYFVATGGTPKDMDITVSTNTVDNLDFQVGDAINIFASPSNFGNGQGDQTGNSYARAILTPNNKTNTATAHYYLYLNITKNELEYTTASHKAELMLTVTDGNDNIVSITGLPEVKDGEDNVIGYDITEEEGLITILNNHEIVANGTKTENWNVKVTFINLPDKQNNNAGKLFTAKVLIQENEYITLATYIQRLYNTDGVNGLYLHDGVGTYTNSNLEAGDNSLRYTGANPNNYVCFGYDDSTEIYNSNWCPTENLYRVIGVFENKVKLIKTDFVNEDILGTNGEPFNTYNSLDDYLQNSWNINNQNAPATVSMFYTLYKGINSKKSTYTWNGVAEEDKVNYNLWSDSFLNKVNLNTNYLNYIGTKWSNMIEETYWKVGGNNEFVLMMSNAKSAYDNEITNHATKEYLQDYKAKIGLMYLSDYYYAALPQYWNLPGFDAYYECEDDDVYCVYLSGNDYTSARSDNWLFIGDREWTITREHTDNRGSKNVFYIWNDGGQYTGDCTNEQLSVRPAFYLCTSIQYTGGTGTASDPYRIK